MSSSVAFGSAIPGSKITSSCQAGLFRKSAMRYCAAVLANGVVYSDMTQLAYTGYASYLLEHPGTWFFTAGYAALSYALPATVGGQIAAPNHSVMVIVGDGGFQFTLQELGTACQEPSWSEN
jgi:thiamine pyrophosphate-dependent acetolactate synthase large subunit-like protein